MLSDYNRHNGVESDKPQFFHGDDHLDISNVLAARLGCKP
jgi:hypothetical protein